MIENTKCECGHQNPVGTVLCESCGNPLLDDDDMTSPLEMRYDGVARRSQKQNPNLIDKVWNFFSSVKIAIYLIVITLVASMLGTIYPQENTFINTDFSVYYKDQYGTAGYIYYLLGLSHTFDSWWYLTLLFMIGTSLVICSLDRVLPLYRALSKQQIRKHISFIMRQKVVFQTELPPGSDQSALIANVGKHLKKRHYRVHSDGTALLAEKYRFSRWGPYINHIGLIVFLLAVLARTIPGLHMDQYIGFLEGQVVKIPETPYYIKNEKFTVEFYKPEEMTDAFKKRDLSVPKVYETDALLYMCKADCDDPAKKPQLEIVHRQKILVNEPLSYKGLLAYQFDYKETPMLLSVKPKLTNKQTGEVLGTFDLDMFNPQDTYQAGAYTLKVKGYFPDFGLDEKGIPMTKTKNPNAPAFIFSVTGPNLAKDGEIYMYFPRQIDKEQYRQDDINGSLASKLDISVGSMDDVHFASYTSYLNIRKDLAMPYVWVGLGISMLGLLMGTYWQHRRVWVRIDENTLSLGAHTNKNWFGIRKEVSDSLNKSGIVNDMKQLSVKGGSSA